MLRKHGRTAIAVLLLLGIWAFFNITGSVKVANKVENSSEAASSATELVQSMTTPAQMGGVRGDAASSPARSADYALPAAGSEPAAGTTTGIGTEGSGRNQREANSNENGRGPSVHEPAPSPLSTIEPLPERGPEPEAGVKPKSEPKPELQSTSQAQVSDASGHETNVDKDGGSRGEGQGSSSAYSPTSTPLFPAPPSPTPSKSPLPEKVGRSHRPRPSPGPTSPPLTSAKPHKVYHHSVEPFQPTNLPEPDPAIQVSMMTPYYNAPDFLRQQFHRWRSYSESTRREMEIIIVDDGSQKLPLRDVVKEFKEKGLLPDMRMKFVEITKDVGFNHCGSINTAAIHARGKMFLFADLDHWFDSIVMDRLMERIRRRSKFGRRVSGFQKLPSTHAYNHSLLMEISADASRSKQFAEMNAENSSPNTLLVNRGFFWETGGMDEIFTGSYGYNDIAWRQCCDVLGVKQETYHWDHGKGIWAVYAWKGGSEGFDRDLSEALSRWESRTSQHIWCNPEPIARVPYREVYAHKWDGAGIGA